MSALPRVSVILPARNEARRVLSSLHSLTALDYPDLEICVVDDRSTDNTAALAENFIKHYQGDKRIALLRSPQEPPRGWVGKTFATDFAIAHSQGTLLLVCDVDVKHMPTSLQHIVTEFQQKNLDLLAQLPHFDVRSVGEYPLLFHTFLLYFSSAVCRTLGSQQSFAMGTYLLFTREFYQQSGGWHTHRAYPESLPLLNWCIAHRRKFLFRRDCGEIVARMHEGAWATFHGLVRNSNFALLQPLPLLIYVGYVTLCAWSIITTAVGSLVGTLGGVILLAWFVVHLMRCRYTPGVIVGASIFSVFMPLYLLLVGCTASLRQIFNLPLRWRDRPMRP